MYNQHHQYYDRAELPPGSYAYAMAKHLTSDGQRAGLADASKLRDRYWGPYKVLKWVNSADVELEIPKSNTGAHNVFHISRLKKAADTAAEAKKLELPRWMRKGFPSRESSRASILLGSSPIPRSDMIVSATVRKSRPIALAIDS